LAPFGQRARQHPEGIIDLSVGTPVDHTPELIQKALRESSNSPGYPLTAGTPELRTALRNWASDRLGATGDFEVLPTIGSKEFVAWLPTFLGARQVLYPEIAYPTYLVGALLAGAQGFPVGVDPKDWMKSDLVWINSPSNPTGRVLTRQEISDVIEWSRKTGTVVASDECYLEFADKVEPFSILSMTGGDNKNILAVHSLSKRSSIAGYRAAFIVGDSDLVRKIREIRKHAGMMVPLPIQDAMLAALGEERHVVEQRARYNSRRAKLVPALRIIGFEVPETHAGLYIWCTRNETDMESVAWFAELGILVTPGHFYGVKGATHIRIALTASDDDVAKAVERITQSLQKNQ